MLYNIVKNSLLLFLFIHLSKCSDRSQKEDNRKLQEKLNEEERNSRCCAKNLPCSKTLSEPTEFEVRALLVKCQPENYGVTTCPKDSASVPKKPTFIDLQNQEEIKEIKNCRKKLLLTIKIRNKGLTNTKNQYIVIDHVYDSVTEKKQRLLNPYVLRFKQLPLVETYELSYEHVVNSEAKEKVYNKEDHDYRGCSTDIRNPTCGIVKYQDQVIPYSTGFCCPCDKSPVISKRKVKRDVGSELMRHEINDPPAIKDDAKRFDDFNGFSIGPGDNKYDEGNYEFTSEGGQIVLNTPIVINFPKIVPGKTELDVGLDSGYGRPTEIIDVRQNNNDKPFTPGKFQSRGGQDCSDTFTPAGVDPSTYHMSTHCLEFSDLWYLVYSLKKPVIEHSIQLEIFEKHDCSGGGSLWKDITKGQPLYIGTSNKQLILDDGTISLRYSKGNNDEPYAFSLNYKIHEILVPEPMQNLDAAQNPELKCGPGEYLVINKTNVCLTGKTCNVAGVGYEAFVKQPHRCSRPRGSCLKNQPKHMWLHDHKLQQEGKTGKYFLKYFGKLADHAIDFEKKESHNHSISLYYTEVHTSTVDLQMAADFNMILKPDTSAFLTEVYVDATSNKRTNIIVKVVNSGLVSSVFYVGLNDCPLDIPTSFNSIASKPALIAPQQQHIFNLEIEVELPVDQFYCSVEVLNVKEELIAARRVRIAKQDRCVCIWHCLCACLIIDKGLKCKHMSLEHYHAAGFQGSLPVALHVVQYTFLDDMLSLMLYILLFLCLTLLIMGLTKALIGAFCSVAIGLWGLDVILDLPKKLSYYLEKNLRHREVEYNDAGWPIHPDTKKMVRNISLPAEFCMNLIFFIVYPFAIMFLIIKKLCYSPYTYEEPIEEKKIGQPRYIKPSSFLKETPVYIAKCECGQNQSISKRNSFDSNSSKRKVSR